MFVCHLIGSEVGGGKPLVSPLTGGYLRDGVWMGGGCGGKAISSKAFTAEVDKLFINRSGLLIKIHGI